AQEYHDKLAGEKQNWRQSYQNQLGAALESQRGALYRQFNRLIRFRVDQERGGRLANLEQVQDLLKELEGISRSMAGVLRAQTEAAHINQALLAMRQVVDQGVDQHPVDLELVTLQRLTRDAAEASRSGTGHDYQASVAALASVQDQVADEGIQTLPALRNRFRLVREQIRRTALVPEDGGMLSHTLSMALSKLMFKKQGLVGGEDTEAILARTEYYLDQGDLDSATRELNQLTGWSKQVSRDWLEAARQHLGLKQALQVVETELMMNQLALP
ncbi:mitochondrial inner membrane protein Mitofilin, partial [Dimargaris cristalligena]